VSKTRTIKVDALSRVEGEGGLHVSFQGETVDQVRLSIYEPPRFFEAFLRGRPLAEVPDIVARICGICPVAYQMSSVHALERALDVTISPEVRRLRRLLYCGEWIESHALHVHLLNAPDFFGCESGLDLVEICRDEFQRGLRLKKHGNELLEMLGGRAIHPVNVAVGGFYRAPRRAEVEHLIPDFEWGLEAAVATTRWVAGFDFPDFERPYEMVSLSHRDEYPMNEGRVVTSSGLSIEVTDYENHFEERQVPHSTALHSVRKNDGTCYCVGPMARVNLNFDRLSTRARQVAEEIGFSVPCDNPFKMIIARGLELVHAYEEALEILRNYRPFSPSRSEVHFQTGEGCAATEAPRGLIYHRYAVDETGKVTFAKIVPPTSQNQAQIEDDLRAWIPTCLNEDEKRMSLDCERLIRCYDPCISCSTHFLKLTVERNAAGRPTAESGTNSSSDGR
jgi:coenzyme F420-reducing hydrogenase alpha subunit